MYPVGGGFTSSVPELTLEVEENAADVTVVGTVTGTDPESDVLFYTLTDDAGGRFAIELNSGVITVADGSSLDYESNTSHNVTVRVTDSASNIYEEVLTIQITDVNEAPTINSAAAVSAAENNRCCHGHGDRR